MTHLPLAAVVRVTEHEACFAHWEQLFDCLELLKLRAMLGDVLQ